MHADGVGSSLDKGLHVVLRSLDHQVHREVPGASMHQRAKGLDHQGSHGDVGDEMAVHDIDMDYACPAVHDLLDLLSQAAEVGRQDRREKVHLASHALWYCQTSSFPALFRLSRQDTGSAGARLHADAPP